VETIERPGFYELADLDDMIMRHGAPDTWMNHLDDSAVSDEFLRSERPCSKVLWEGAAALAGIRVLRLPIARAKHLPDVNGKLVIHPPLSILVNRRVA
jgi:hypothetical protein